MRGGNVLKKCKICLKPNPRRLSTCSYECEKEHIARKQAEKIAKKKREKWVKSRGITVTKLNTLWSKKVRSKGVCEYCEYLRLRCEISIEEYTKNKRYLHAHHIYSRKNKSVIWDINNGICLCSKHHTFSDTFSAHKTPTEFTYWLESIKGRAFIDDLKVKAHKINDKSLEEWYEILNKTLV